MRTIALFSAFTLALALGLTGCTAKTRKPGKGPKAHKTAKGAKTGVKKGAKKTVAKDKWVLLGERKVDFKAESDVIKVTATEGVFKKIQLRVKGRGVQFIDLKVTFGNGETHDVKIRKVIEKGGQTRVIDLPGKDRVIRKVVMTYRSVVTMKTKGKKNATGKAHVRLFGRR